jgi:hypothetical protein
MQEPPLPKEPPPVSEQLPISIDGQEPVPISSGEVELWVQDNLCTPLAVESNPTSAGHTRPPFPSSPDSPAAPVYRRIMSGGRYKVPLLLLPPADDTPVQSISYMATPSRGCSPCHLLSSLFPLMLLPVTSDLPVRPSPTTEAATSEEYSPEDATPPGGHQPCQLYPLYSLYTRRMA